MTYIGKAPQLQGAYEKADNLDSQFNSALVAFSIEVGAVAKPIAKATNLIVSLNGVLLEPDTAYTVTGSTITFTVAPTTGHHCWITILGDVGAV